MSYSVPLVNPAPQAYYSPTPLAVPTYTGTGYATEPACRFVPGGWNGHRWWMAFSPLDASTSTENPSVVASDDGQTWTAPATNPIVPQRGDSGNNADAYLYLDPSVTSTAYLVYLVEGGTTDDGFWGCSSTNGTTWITPVKLKTKTASANEPKLIYDRTSGLWRLYWADYANGLFYVTNSNPLATSGWSAPVTCTVNNYASLVFHWDIICEPTGRWIAGFYPPATAPDLGATIASSWDGITWTCASRPILEPAHSGSWAVSVYRPSVVRLASGYYGVVYGGHDGSNNWHLGYCTIPATEIP